MAWEIDDGDRFRERPTSEAQLDAYPSTLLFGETITVYLC